MTERLILTVLIFALSGGVYYVWQYSQRMLLSGKAEVRDTPQILYFRSDSCATCPTQLLYLQQLQQAHPVIVETIDVQQLPQKAAEFNVMTLPTTIVVAADGKVRQINYGLTDARKLARQLAA